MKKLFYIFVIGILFASCSEQQARKPISHSSGTFIKESIERNKILNEKEEKWIVDFIKKDSSKTYIASPKGYWYTYNKKNIKNEETPKYGDIVFFDYEIKDLEGTIIYSKVALKPQKYAVDKENILMGLRDGIKLMKKNETVTFLFPSHIAYGYHGDENKIGTNQPIQCIVTLNEIKKENKITN